MFAEWRKVLLGIHPEWRHSPPIRARSIKAVLAPDRFAAEAATRPAEPAPMTQMSYSFIHPSPLAFFHRGIKIKILLVRTMKIFAFVFSEHKELKLPPQDILSKINFYVGEPVLA
jgi:hypothetical protein